MLIDEFEGEWGGTCERVCREKWEKKNVIIKYSPKNKQKKEAEAELLEV